MASLAVYSIVVVANALSKKTFVKDTVQVAQVIGKTVPTEQVYIEPNIQIKAKSAFLYDIKTGKTLYQKNPEETLPLASIAKLMTAMVILSDVREQDIVTILAEDIEPEGNTGLIAGDTYTVRDLLHLGIVASSNDAITALARHAGTDFVVNKMNIEASALGMNNASFSSPTGLDIDETHASAYGNTRDVAMLVWAFYKKYPQYFQLTRYPIIEVGAGSDTITAGATDAPILNIPGLMAAKTGYTDLAGGNLVAIVDLEIGHPVIAVVLSSTAQERFSDIKTLVNVARATPQRK